MDFTLDRIKTHHGVSQGAASARDAILHRASPRGLTLLSSYWSNTQCGAQLLELTAVSRIRREWAEGGG
jgi:hypothetical protein